MYLRKIDGPRTVTLPDGTILARSDLPSTKTRRWVASRKAVVVKAVQHGLISIKDALDSYGLSEDEFNEWRHAVETHGEAALKATALKKYRSI